MAENLGLQVEVGANIKPLTKGLADARKELATTAASAVKLDSSLGKLGSGTNQATNAMTNLGRIVQDAPFGLIGITNNINPLLESFQRLKAETGSTGTALKALAGSLVGAGGLGLAVSVISSLLTVFALNSRSSGEATKEHKEKIDETKKAADDYSRAISAASSAVLSHQNKLADLNLVLRDASNNFNTLSHSIINQALAQYLATQKEGLIKKILDNKIKQLIQLNKVMNPLQSVQEFTTLDLFSKDPLKKGIAEAEADLKNLNKMVQSLGLQGIFNDIFKLDTVRINPKKIEVEEPKIIDLSATIKALNRSFDKTPLFRATGSTLTPTLNLKPKIFIEITPEEQKKVLDSIQALFNAEKIQAIMDRTINSAVSNLADSFAGILSGAKNGFSGLFDGLASTLAGGLKEIGKYLVETYLLIGTIQKIKFSNPAVGVAVGFALQVLGGLIQSKINSTKAFATGVRNFEGGVALVGERGPELVNLPRGSGVIPNNETMAYGGGSNKLIAEYIMRGPDLVTVIRRAEAQMSRNG